MSIFNYLVLALIPLAGCTLHVKQNDEGMSSMEKQKVCNEVEKTLLSYQKDIREHGLIAELEYLDSSEDFFWVPPGYHSAIGYDSVAGAVRKNGGNYAKVDDVFRDLRIIALGHQLATYTCKTHSSVTMRDGAVHEFTLLETGVMIRRGKDWKIHSGQTNLIQE